MDELIARALDTATAQGAHYADVRRVRQERQLVLVRNGTVEAVSLEEDAGFGVRALVDGAWGFASSYKHRPRPRWTPSPPRRCASPGPAPGCTGARWCWASRCAAAGQYRTPVQRDPFAVPLDEQIALLLRADDGDAPGARGSRPPPGRSSASGTTKTFASTEGAYIEQEIVQTGCGIEATAVGEGEVQQRSYPNSGGRHQVCEGWEFVARADLEAARRRGWPRRPWRC